MVSALALSFTDVSFRQSATPRPSTPSLVESYYIYAVSRPLILPSTAERVPLSTSSAHTSSHTYYPATRQ